MKVLLVVLVLLLPDASAQAPQRFDAHESGPLGVGPMRGFVYLDRTEPGVVDVQIGTLHTQASDAASVVYVTGRDLVLEAEGAVYAAFVREPDYREVGGGFATIHCETGVTAWSAFAGGRVVEARGAGPAVLVYGSDPSQPFMMAGFGSDRATAPAGSALLWVVHSAGTDCAGSVHLRLIEAGPGIGGETASIVALIVLALGALLYFGWKGRRRRGVPDKGIQEEVL